jgi:CRISPR-associated protein Cas1
MELHLQSFGARLRATGSLFKLTKTDLEQRKPEETHEYAAHQVKTLLLQKGTSVSTDALLLALEHDITVVILDQFSQPQGYLFPTKPSSTIAIWKRQIAISLAPEGLLFAKSWIEEKIKSRIEFLQQLAEKNDDLHKRDILTKAAADMTRSLSDLRFVHVGGDLKAEAHTIRGYESNAGRPYYAALSATLPKYYRFNGRSYRPATDSFNAFLNYGYAILYRHCTRALWMAGVNPYIGFMHYDGYQRHSLTFDFVEPYRVWVEKTVYQLFLGKRISNQHASKHPEHGYWLSETGKRLLALMLDKRLTQKKRSLGQLEYTEENYLRERARRFSSSMLPRNQQAS